MRFRSLLAVAFVTAAHSAFAAPLPSSYSVANAGFMVPIKNQGALGACWSFSSTTVFETTLARQGLMSAAEAGNLVSEWDMAVHAGEKITFKPPYFNRNWGAFPQQAVGYLVRGFGRWQFGDLKNPVGGGAVAMSNSALNVYPIDPIGAAVDISSYAPPANQPLLPFRLRQTLEFLDETAQPGKPASPAFREEVKRAILKYGALDTSMQAKNLLGATNTMNRKYDTYAWVGKSSATDHDVTIIGWNDDVAVLNESGQFLGKGAWLIQNSWGTGSFKAKDAVSKPDGCFWLGYCDTAAVKYACAYVLERRGAISDTVLQNQIFNYGGEFTLSTGSARGKTTYAAEKLTAQTDAKLLAIGLWTVADHSALDLDIYAEWGAKGPAGARLASVRGVVAPTSGYVEVPLDAPVPLTAGQRIYVVVNFGSSIANPIALDARSLKIRGLDVRNLTWMSDDGVKWHDLSDAGGVFFMKGILGGKRVRQGGATLSVTGVDHPIVATGSTATLRGTASFNTDRVLWRLDDGKVRRAQSGRAAWKIAINGLAPGRNLVSIWPTTATGVATKPVKVTITRR